MLEWIWVIVQPIVLWLEDHLLGLGVLFAALSLVLMIFLCAVVAARGW
jgi:hypothetical protein